MIRSNANRTKGYLLLLKADEFLRDRCIAAALRRYAGPVVGMAPTPAFPKNRFFDHVLKGDPHLATSALQAVAKRHGVTPAQVAIAWGMRDGNTISIPKAADAAHVRENAAAAGLTLTTEDLAAIDAAHPPPKRKTALDLL